MARRSSLRSRLLWPRILLFSCLCVGSLPASEVGVDLVDGNRITGSIVKETGEAIFIDIGYTILEVPRSSIERLTRGKGAAGTGAGTAVSEAQGSVGAVSPEEQTGESTDYRMGRDEPVSVRDAVARLGEGVVRVRCPGGQGSGFIINERGHVITNYHVIEGERDVEIDIYLERADGLEKKRFKEVDIIAINEFFDLALLRIADEELAGLELTPLAFGDPEEIAVGEPVFAIGAPLGLDRTVTEGIVSDASRSFEGMCYIQVDVAINPGNSGGPLFNSHGEVIGVTNMGFRGTEGLNFAIPIDHVMYFIDRRASFLYDESRPNSGVHYFEPPRKKKRVQE